MHFFSTNQLFALKLFRFEGLFRMRKKLAMILDLVKIILADKNFEPKRYVTNQKKIIFVPPKIWAQKIFSPRIFGHKNFVTQIKIVNSLERLE